MRVLVVECEPAAADSLAQSLVRRRHDVRVVHTGAAALQQYQQVDLVLLELELSDVDGLDVCGKIRSASDIPIIAVTSRSSELDRVLGLQAGADDYVVKPYSSQELLARIAAVTRRAGAAPSNGRVISHGDLQIDVGARDVRLNGRSINVTRREFDLLHLLASRPSEVVPRRLIMRKVWNYDWATPSRTIDTHVSTLRSKLGSSSWIVTVRGVGFRLGGTDGSAPRSA